MLYEYFTIFYCKKNITTEVLEKNKPTCDSNFTKLILSYFKADELYGKAVKNKRKIPATTLPLGFNIVAGKISFEIHKILDPNEYAPTLVAMGMQGLYVVDGDGLRTLTLREGGLKSVVFEYAVSDNTQMPPDFFLNPNSEEANLLEVKAFNRLGSPGFDIADFRMYEEELVEKPYILDVYYFIFGYDMSDDGIVTIKDLWIKKVLEITRCMNDWSVNLQIKQNVVHKIRPGVWYSTRFN